MAGPITCDLCGAEVAAYVIGDTATGDQQWVGPGCLIAWCLAQLTTRLDAEALQATATELYKSTLPDEQAEDAAPRRGRKRAQPAAQAVEQPAEPAEEDQAAPPTGDG